MSGGIEIKSLIIFSKIVFGRKRRFIAEYVGLTSVASLSILILLATRFLLDSEGLSYQLESAMNLSNAWITVLVILVSFLALVTFRLTANKEDRKEAALFTELGASRHYLFGLFLLRALIFGVFAGSTGFSIIRVFSMYLRWDTNLGLLAFSILMVSSSTFISELYALRRIDRSAN
jgi:predicted lysophospholipase L1 biosynthesis ABC-type transport system permease subunit